MVGKVLAGRYELIEKIAEGGMARVYRGRDQILKRTVAVKVLKDQMTGDASFIRRFEREAQSAAALSHPHIVNIYDVGEEDGIPFMVMEFVNGKNLKEYIREKGRLAGHEAIRIATQIAEALEQAHAAGVVHRDIKPQNILFSREGKVKVTDFGIAIAGDGVTVTVGDEIIGSVQYISPEQARGSVAGRQSDLYSLGIVLYEMVTGKVPFSGESPVAVAMKHIQEQIVPPGQIVDSLSPALESRIMKAVEKDAANRYQEAGEILKDLFYAEDRGGQSFVPRRNLLKEEDEDDVGSVLKPSFKDVDQDLKKADRRRRIFKLIKVFFFLALPLALAYGAYYFINTYFIVPEVTVPDVSNMSQSEASLVLREAGLEPISDIMYIFDDSIQVGYVVKTDPPEGRVVRENRGVNLFISKGPEFLITPDLVGRTEMEARVILGELELRMTPVREYNDDIPEGEIYRQVPAESVAISRGEEVVVYISQGRGPFEIVDLIGFSEGGAIQYLEENELRPRLRYKMSIGSRGHVIEQDPLPGAEVLPGDFVELVIGE